MWLRNLLHRVVFDNKNKGVPHDNRNWSAVVLPVTAYIFRRKEIFTIERLVQNLAVCHINGSKVILGCT